MQQYINQRVTLNVTNSYFPAKRQPQRNDDSTDESVGVLCDFKIDEALEKMSLSKFTIEQVENALNLIQCYKLMPLQVS